MCIIDLSFIKKISANLLSDPHVYNRSLLHQKDFRPHVYNRSLLHQKDFC